MDAADFARRQDNLIRLGTIAEVDHATARCRIKSGNLLTDWLPWYTGRAGTTKNWNPPTVGEQCLVLSPSGESVQAIVMPGVFSKANGAPANSGDVWHIQMPDGALLEYNHASHTLTANLPNGAITITAPAGVRIVGDLTVTGDVIAGPSAISLTQHVHNGVQSGGSNTDHPQ